MPAGAITLAVGAYAASESKKASKNATKAITQGNDQATAEQARQFDITQQNQQPWLNLGTNAIGGLNRILAGDFSEALNSPDYQVARDEGLRGLNRGLAATGGATPGQAADADRIQFASNLGTMQLGSFRQFLLGASGLGQDAANQIQGAGQTYATNVGNLARDTAGARASSFQQRADTNSQLAGLLGGGANKWIQGGYKLPSFGPGTI